MDELIIEQLDVADWRVYRAIRLIALFTDPQAFSPTFEKEAAYPDEHWQARLQDASEGKTVWMYFARLNGKFVGMMGGYRDQADLIDHSAQIWGVFVNPEARGKGIARKLLAALIDRLSQVPDINRLKLAVNTEQKSAIKLYEGFGFSTTKTIAMQSENGVLHQAAQMEKWVTSPPVPLP